MLLDEGRDLISRKERGLEVRVVLEAHVVEKAVGERKFVVGGLVSLHLLLVLVGVQQPLLVIIVFVGVVLLLARAAAPPLSRRCALAPAAPPSLLSRL